MPSRLIKVGRKRGTPLIGLNPKHREFCERYLTNGMNGADAAREAGYSNRSAAMIARNLLSRPDVNSYLCARRTELESELTMQRHELLDIMRRVLKFNLMKHAKGSGKKGRVTFLVEEEKYDEVAEMIGDLVTRVVAHETVDEDGTVHRKIEVELMSKDKMYELALKYAGMIDHQNNKVDVSLNVGPELIERLLANIEVDNVVDGRVIEHRA